MSLLAENCTLALANEGLAVPRDEKTNSQLEEQCVTKKVISHYTIAKLGVVRHL